MDAINPDHYKRLPAEAIEIIEAAIDNAPSNQDAYLHGQALKYLLRCWHKNGIEDLRKSKWYLDRLIDSFDEREPEQPKPTLNSDKIPEGYRKLKNSSIEPRQRGDLRWSIAEKRYIEIGFDEIGYANRENWAACRRTTGEATGEVAGEVKPPDGWRWLEVGEVIRKGDLRFKDGLVYTLEPIVIGIACQEHWMPIVRRNRFEVGEKVVYTIDNTIWTFKSEIDEGPRFPKSAWVTWVTGIGKMSQRICVNHLAPYIEETKPTTEVDVEVTGEVKNPLGCPDGYRWLEVGEVIRKGDRYFKNQEWHSYDLWVGAKITPSDRPSIRRNKFEVGEKVVHGDLKSTSISTVKSVLSDGWVDLVRDGVSNAYHVKDLAPYIEETK